MTAHEHFHAIWHRARNGSSLELLTPELIQSWAAERGLNVTSVEERASGAFGRTSGIVLTTSDAKAFFPKIPTTGDAAWAHRRQAADHDAALWEKVEWFSPFWVPMGKAKELLASVRHCDKARAIEEYNYHTSTIYTLAFEAVCIAQIMPSAPSLREFCPLAREAYLAFYSGYRASSISALIPAIEGSLTRITSHDGSAAPTIADKVDRAVDRAISRAASLHFAGMWVPPEYLTCDYLFARDERVFAFETFRRWILNSFFQKTPDYDGATWLNRHLFAHGAATLWQQSANFSRLIVALATIGLVESWHDETDSVSIFLPEMNDDSTLLWQQALFQGEAQMMLKMIEQDRYQKHGRLVPEMPTDNGALLRKGILSEDCIKDLVRPLRDAGWNVYVAEPDETGLYMTVTATVEGKRFGAALLYSCGTANEIYRKLAETCDAILYRGAPYKQQSYAYGIDVHVGPVAGWRPPSPG